MINFINENATTIITLLTGSTFLSVASNVIKAFTQKKLNKSFDEFNELNSKKNMAINFLNREVTDVRLILEEFMDLNDIVIDLIDEIKTLKTDSILTELGEAIKDLEVVKQALDYKDNIIEAYNKDIQTIKIALKKLLKEGGFVELLETEKET